MTENWRFRKPRAVFGIGLFGQTGPAMAILTDGKHGGEAARGCDRDAVRRTRARLLRRKAVVAGLLRENPAARGELRKSGYFPADCPPF